MIRNIGARIMKNQNIKAVHDEDLEKLLQSLGVYENVIAGNYKCLFCSDVITLDNLDSIIPYEHNIGFTCDNADCHLKLIGWKK